VTPDEINQALEELARDSARLRREDKLFVRKLAIAAILTAALLALSVWAQSL
jgi:hypothetical protein